MILAGSGPLGVAIGTLAPMWQSKSELYQP